MTFISQEKIEPLFLQHIHTNAKTVLFLGFQEQERKEEGEMGTNILTGKMLMYRFPT